MKIISLTIKITKNKHYGTNNIIFYIKHEIAINNYLIFEVNQFKLLRRNKNILNL